MGSFVKGRQVSFGTTGEVRLFSRCTITTTGRTFTSTKLSVRRRSPCHIKAVVNSNVKDLDYMRRGCSGVRAGKPTHMGPLVIPLVVSGVTTKGMSVRLNLGKGYASIIATYTSKSGDVKSTLHTVRCNSLSIYITNNARDYVYPAKVTKFATLATLSAGRSPVATSHPFSRSESKFILKRKTKVMILRRLRRTGTENTGVCTRLTKCNSAKSTCRVASPTRGKRKTKVTVGLTVGRTNIAPSRMSCVGTRKADARRGSLFRAHTVCCTLKSTTRGMVIGSAGSVVNRLLKTTKTMRFIIYMGDVLSGFVRRAINAGGMSPRYKLGCTMNTPMRGRIGYMVSGSLKFNKRGISLLMGHFRRWKRTGVGVRRVLGLVRTISTSRLASFGCRRGKAGLGLGGRRRGIRVVRDPKMIPIAKAIATNLRATRVLRGPKGRTSRARRRRRRIVGRARNRLVISPLIKAFCTTPTRSTPDFIGINSGIRTKRIIKVVRTVGLVGRVRDRYTNAITRILMRGKRPMRCNRPVFEVIWREGSSVGDLGMRRVRRVVPRERPFLLVSGVRSCIPKRCTVKCGNISCRRSFFHKRFPRGTMVPKILVLRTLTRAKTITVLDMPRGRKGVTFFNNMRGYHFGKVMFPKSRLGLRAGVVGEGKPMNMKRTITAIGKGVIIATRLAFVIKRWGGRRRGG